MTPPKSPPPFDLNILRELSKILHETDLTEIELEHEGLRLRVARQAHSAIPENYQITSSSAPKASAQPEQTAKEKTELEHEMSVKSPMVGTVYLRPDPNSSPFVQTGDKVKKGDTLLLIEAMKTFNPVYADKTGSIKKILVEDAQPVEFGEALILIE